MTKIPFVRSIFATLALPVASAAYAARADRCDDLATQLKNQIDGLTVGKTAANLIYLSHPKAKELTLGCAGRSYANQLYAKSDSRKPQADFIDLVASAAAIVFTQPKDNMLKGATRCIKRMGLLHGDDVATRYRRLDMRCVADQDRRLDHDLPQHGRVSANALRRAVRYFIGRRSCHSPCGGIGPDARGLRFGFTKHSLLRLVTVGTTSVAGHSMSSISSIPASPPADDVPGQPTTGAGPEE